jgi:hypothetical protein
MSRDTNDASPGLRVIRAPWDAKKYTRRVQPVDLAADAFVAFGQSRARIRLFLEMAHEGMPSAEQEQVRRLVAHEEYIKRELPQYYELQVRDHPADRSARQFREQAEAAIDASAIVFAHLAVTTALVDTLLACARAQPEKWAGEHLKSDRVKLETAFKDGVEDPRQAATEDVLRNKSLPEIANLYRKVDPGDTILPFGGFEKVVDNLKAFSQLRNDIVHRGSQATPGLEQMLIAVFNDATCLMWLAQIFHGWMPVPDQFLKPKKKRKATLRPEA